MPSATVVIVWVDVEQDGKDSTEDETSSELSDPFSDVVSGAAAADSSIMETSPSPTDFKSKVVLSTSPAASNDISKWSGSPGRFKGGTMLKTEDEVTLVEDVISLVPSSGPASGDGGTEFRLRWPLRVRSEHEEGWETVPPGMNIFRWWSRIELASELVFACDEGGKFCWMWSNLYWAFNRIWACAFSWEIEEREMLCHIIKRLKLCTISKYNLTFPNCDLP